MFEQFEDKLNIHSDLNNPVHGPHYDLLINLRPQLGCVGDQVRISEDGAVLGGTTNMCTFQQNW